MRFLAPITTAVIALTVAASSSAQLPAVAAAPKHGGRWTTYVVSFRAPFAANPAAKSQYVIGAVNSSTCTAGISSFGRIQTGYRAGAIVRFVLRAPRHGWCVGVFHGVAHWERSGQTFRDVRVGRFGFRVLSHA